MKAPEIPKAQSNETSINFLCNDRLFIDVPQTVPFALVPSFFNSNPEICFIKNLEKIFRDTAGTHPLKMKFTTTIDTEYGLLENKKVALQRIAREQMKNIIRHSYARNVRISLVTNSLGIVMYIYDDGTGFDLRTSYTGPGLAEIYKMAEVFNGSADIITSPGEGCSLTVLVPASQCITLQRRFIE
jgi:signal transduction histidine kinase